MVRAHIIFSGTVQGVGFRFMVQRCATSFGLTGWVKNLPDGSVEILAEGPDDKIGRLCQNIEEHFKGYIRDKDIQYTPARKEFKNFQIAY